MTTSDRNDNDIQQKIRQWLRQHAIQSGEVQIVMLQNIIEQTIQHNKNLGWDEHIQNVFLATDPEILLNIFALRSKTYEQLGYTQEYPDKIPGLNFDDFDPHSAVLYTRAGNKVTGTCRVIFDSEKRLPMDRHYSINHLRKSGKQLAELSRLVIDKTHHGLGQEPRLLTAGTYKVMVYNNRTTLISSMLQDHFRFYDRFGGFRIEGEMEQYGNISKPFIVTTWDIQEITSYFKKTFLKAS